MCGILCLLTALDMAFFSLLEDYSKETLYPPNLFILAAEAVSKALNYLHEKDRFVGYTMNNRGPKIILHMQMI